jgi:OOP family OmpA-OmpF porin
MPNCGAPAIRASALALLAAAAPALAADPFNSDRPGGADHVLLSRYQGSMLFMYGEDPAATAQVLFEDKGKPVLRAVEGRVSNRLYWGPKGRSPLEVYRNYRQALEAAGFQAMYACEAQQCEAAKVQPMVANLPRTAAWKARDIFVDGTFNSGSQPGFHYFSGRKVGPGGTTYVAVALAGGFPDAPVLGRVRQFIEIVEPAKIELGKVTVDAKAIQGGLQRDGKIALYGVTFDTNQAVLREESAAQLGEMASVLKAAPALKVFIVGHTDNQGELQANTLLSQKRADAVVAALSSRHGIAPARLVARGVANLAPVSSNDAEEGRARNRRVEMVVR